MMSEEPVLEENVPTTPRVFAYKVVASRTQPREGGKICIEVNVSDSNVTERWPLESFIGSDGFFTDDDVFAWVTNWNQTAELYPNNRRLCLMCARRSKKGFTLCGHCFNVYGQAVYG